MENVRKHADIKLVTAERKINYLVSTKLSRYKIFHRKCNSNRNEKNSNNYEKGCLCKTIDIGTKENCNI